MNKPIPTRSDPWARWAKILLALIVSATLLALAGCAPRDDSDSVEGRSGLVPRTDALTGCQYLTGPSGSITPRLGRDGKQVCK